MMLMSESPKKEEEKKPTLKELMTGKVLDGYVEAARVKPLTAFTPCDVCGNVEGNWDRGWFVSDEEWQQVVPLEYQNKTLCPWCFIKFASQKGKQYEIKWSDDVAYGVTMFDPEAKRREQIAKADKLLKDIREAREK